MALWRIARIEMVPGPPSGNPTAVVTLVDKDSGDVKQEAGMLPPGVLGTSQEDFLCELQVTKGYTPNDFGQACVGF